MSEMIERVARALHACVMQHDVEQPPWEHLSRPFREECLSMARAAIEAMREPTRSMVSEAMIQPHPSVAEAGGVIQQGEEAVRIDWRAMIDEALKPVHSPD